MDAIQLQHLFSTIIQYMAVFYLTLSVMLWTFTQYKDKIYRRYRQARRMMATAYGLITFNLVLWCILSSPNWANFNWLIAGIDIVLFYAEELLLCYSFCHILNNSFMTKRRISKNGMQLCLAATLAFMPLVPSMRPYAGLFLLLALAVMLEDVIELAFHFYKQYKLNWQLLDNYFTEDMHQFVRWTRSSIILLIISWVMALVTMFANVYVNIAFQMYMVFIHIYITANFVNFAPKYGSIARAYQMGFDNEDEACTALPNDDDTMENVPTTDHTTDEDSQGNNLEQRINVWKENKEYIGSQFTIDELAVRLETNKNYLSYFINERYDMNFSAWVSSLRVEEAKEMMLSQPDRKLEDIAHAVGFSSPSYFSKVFAYHMGMSPTVWRRTNKN